MATKEADEQHKVHKPVGKPLQADSKSAAGQ